MLVDTPNRGKIRSNCTAKRREKCNIRNNVQNLTAGQPVQQDVTVFTSGSLKTRFDLFITLHPIPSPFSAIQPPSSALRWKSVAVPQYKQLIHDVSRNIELPVQLLMAARTDENKSTTTVQLLFRDTLLFVVCSPPKCVV